LRDQNPGYIIGDEDTVTEAKPTVTHQPIAEQLIITAPDHNTVGSVECRGVILAGKGDQIELNAVVCSAIELNTVPTGCRTTTWSIAT